MNVIFTVTVGRHLSIRTNAITVLYNEKITGKDTERNARQH